MEWKLVRGIVPIASEPAMAMSWRPKTSPLVLGRGIGESFGIGASPFGKCALDYHGSAKSRRWKYTVVLPIDVRVYGRTGFDNETRDARETRELRTILCEILGEDFVFKLD